MKGRRLQKYVTDATTLPSAAAAAWRSEGVRGVWTEVRRRTVDRAGGYVRYIVLEADLVRYRPISVPEGIVIRPFIGAEWSRLGGLASRRITPAFTAALGEGRVCLVAWRGTEAVGFIWFSPVVEPRYESFTLRLPGDANYLWQLLVAPSSRRQGVGAALISAGFDQAIEQGIRRSWMMTSPTNTAAQRTIASLAPTRVLGTISRVKLASWMHSRFVPFPDPTSLPSGSRP